MVTASGENLGVLPRDEALRRAREAGLDLIEISPNANPPVAKIIDYGKFHYDLKKKAKVVQVKAHITETKTIQVKIGTGEHDLMLKAKRASEWLKQGDRIKLDLFLPGRSKYMELGFLKERMERMLKLITEQYKIADPPKKSPKGLTVVIERAGK
ncbi:MAG: translation initiation factor IF-3 [Parcubacteria group bacterium Gr01-1014_48]|nr:MAG: translation initiation factor IF-3 [Parcubacteria group bacterium Greene0416_14]TSC73473.1 MAG: translation initiation factor IF-3 [Parcubacteria group bacterium Gr01-1014_48]TSD00560.1 MAG: translation initiation factor IF-3 [Parcubacteria group bacterium Greene1014_15]TSD08253.1 MAG: translation initiation factor IF-3 [Parcubacteria group bacterium Greene0714_4]